MAHKTPEGTLWDQMIASLTPGQIAWFNSLTREETEQLLAPVREMLLDNGVKEIVRAYHNRPKPARRCPPKKRPSHLRLVKSPT